MNEDFVVGDGDQIAESGDAAQHLAIERLMSVFDQHRQSVYFSRQLEVQLEGEFFHWVTNRALRQLVADGYIRREVRELATGGTVTLMWHRSYRYFRREAGAVVALVEKYADPNIGAALGLHGEALVLEGFAINQFVTHGRETRSYGGRMWTETDHDLDFIFERDGIAYGVEVKNTLGYMPHDELAVKIDLCRQIGVKPVIAARMLPKTWINEIIEAGGFALIMKYQLYPWSHRDLAKQVQQQLGLPVDAPRRLADGTMARFVRWHVRSL